MRSKPFFTYPSRITPPEKFKKNPQNSRNDSPNNKKELPVMSNSLSVENIGTKTTYFDTFQSAVKSTEIDLKPVVLLAFQVFWII